MTENKIKSNVNYLEHILIGFNDFRESHIQTTNVKVKESLEFKLYDLMNRAKEYILEENLFELVNPDATKGHKSAFISGLVKLSYFDKDLTGFINKLKNHK